MCEFRVSLGGKEVFRDVIYARQQEDVLYLRDVVGEVRTFPRAVIAEVDVSTSTMVLRQLE